MTSALGIAISKTVDYYLTDSMTSKELFSKWFRIANSKEMLTDNCFSYHE